MITAVLCIGLITSAWFLPQISCDVLHVRTTKDYERVKGNEPRHASFVYNIASKCGKAQAFAHQIRGHLQVVNGKLEELDMKVQLSYTDCQNDPVEALCDEAASKGDYFLLIQHDKNRKDTARLQPGVLSLEDLLGLILEFYSSDWKNLYTVRDVMEVKRAFNDDSKRHWFACYGENGSTGKSLCLELAANYQQRSSIGTIYTEKKSILDDINKHFGTEMNPSGDQASFRLWYLDCLDDEGVQCKSYQYLMDGSLSNARRFVDCVRHPPLVEMAPDGTVQDLKEFQCSLLYFFYQGAKLRLDAAKIQAFHVADQLRGTAIVVAADINQIDKTALEKLDVKKKDTFPLWKFEFRSEKMNKTYNHIEGCPVKFIKEIMNSMKDHESAIPMPATRTMSQQDMMNFQDDEVELMLQSQRDESCYFCPPDFKRVTVLTDKTYGSFIEKGKVAMVLFWLNVDTSSRSALSMTIEASTLLDANYAPFAAVACHDWPDVCQKALVRTWPKMMVHVNGQRGREYKAVWDPKLMANTAMMYASSPVTQIKSAKEMEKFTQGKTVQLINGTYLQTVTVGIFKDEKSRIIKTFTEAGKRLHGHYALGVASGSWTKKWVNDRMGPLELPIIVTHKSNDELEKAVLMDEVEDATQESIIQFVHKSSRPVIASLTVLTFPSIINRKVPLIILIGSNPTKTELFAIMRNAEECLLSRNYVCTTLDVEMERNLSKYLLKAYDLQENDLPVVAYVNTKNGHVHLMKKNAAKKSIRTWLEHINSNVIKPSVILPEKVWTRPPLVYDYMKMSTGKTCDRDKAGKTSESKDETPRGHMHDEF